MMTCHIARPVESFYFLDSLLPSHPVSVSSLVGTELVVFLTFAPGSIHVHC